MSIKRRCHHVAAVRQMFSADSCQPVLHKYCTWPQTALTVPHALAPTCNTSRFLLLLCPALLLIVRKQLQCSFPLFSLCGNVLGEHLSLNRNNTLWNVPFRIPGGLWGLQSHWYIIWYHIPCLNILDRFVHQTVFTVVSLSLWPWLVQQLQYFMFYWI